MLLFIFLKFFHRKSALVTYFTGVFNASNLHQIWQNVHKTNHLTSLHALVWSSPAHWQHRGRVSSLKRLTQTTMNCQIWCLLWTNSWDFSHQDQGWNFSPVKTRLPFSNPYKYGWILWSEHEENRVQKLKKKPSHPPISIILLSPSAFYDSIHLFHNCLLRLEYQQPRPIHPYEHQLLPQRSLSPLKVNSDTVANFFLHHSNPTTNTFGHNYCHRRLDHHPLHHTFSSPPIASPLL